MKNTVDKIYNPTQSSNDYLGQSGCPKNSSCPDWVVKNFNPLDHSQTSYIRKLKVKTASEAAEICKRKFNLSTIDSSQCQNSITIKEEYLKHVHFHQSIYMHI